MNQDVFVVVEHLQGKISDITFEMLGKGREVTDALCGKLNAILIGAAHLAAQLGKADRVLSTLDAALTNYTPIAYKNALVELMQAHQPALTMIGNTSMGMDLAAGASAALGIPLVAYCNNLRVESGKVIATAQIYGGKLLLTQKPRTIR